MYLVLMVIIMEILLTDYIRWFSDNHDIRSLDDDWDGVVVAPVGSDFIIRLGSVTDGE